jgi:very-short-patch-repair endonuclease
MPELASTKNQYHYNPILKEKARHLRRNMSKGEVCLWKYVLKSRQMLGYSFNRQRPVLNYIADFMCKELLLIIEVDGAFHMDEDQYKRDKKRQEALEKVGFTVLRYSDWEVLNQIVDVSIAIRKWIEENKKY